MEYRALTLHYRTFLWITTIEAILTEAGRIESTQIQKNFHITAHFLPHYKELPLLQQRAHGWKRSEHPNLPVHCQQSLITTLLPFFITYKQLFLHFKLRNQKITYPSMKWPKLASCIVTFDPITVFPLVSTIQQGSLSVPNPSKV